MSTRTLGVWRRQPDSAPPVALCLVALLAASGCGGDSGSDKSGEVDGGDAWELPAELDGFLRDSVEALDLDPSDARREERPAPCPGSTDDGVAVRFYFDEPSADRGAELLSDLRTFWAEQKTVTGVGHVEMDEGKPGSEPLGSVSGTAAGGLLLEGWWYPASLQLIVGGSTTCAE